MGGWGLEAVVTEASTLRALGSRELSLRGYLGGKNRSNVAAVEDGALRLRWEFKDEGQVRAVLIHAPFVVFEVVDATKRVIATARLAVGEIIAERVVILRRRIVFPPKRNGARVVEVDVEVKLAGGRQLEKGPRVNIDVEHVRIGDPGDVDMTLFVTVMSAKNLYSLIGANLSKLNMFWIEYCIFGVKVQTEQFNSLRNAKFAPIRDSFQLRSSPEEIAQFFQSTPVQVFLCGTSINASAQVTALANTFIHFDSLFNNNDSQNEQGNAFKLMAQKPFTVDGSRPSPSLGVNLELHRLEKEPENAIHQLGETCRVQVLSFALDPPDVDENSTEKKELKLKLYVKNGKATKELVEEFPFGETSQLGMNDLFVEATADQVKNVVLECRIDGNIFAEGNLEAGCGEVESLQLFDASGRPMGSAQVHLQKREDVFLVSSALQENRNTEEDETFHQYRITIDLRAIKGLEKTYNVFLQYYYPLFGTTHTIQTRPPILIDRFTERIIPHGLNLLQFEASRSQIERASRSEPLVIEIWHRDKYASDKRLGFSVLPLRKLIDARPYFQWCGQTFSTLSAMEAYREEFLAKHAKADSHLATARRNADRLRKQLDVAPIQVQVLETDLIICSFGQDGASGVTKLAQVRCTCTLENLGVVGKPKQVAPPTTPALSLNEERPQHEQEPPAPTSPPASVQEEIRYEDDDGEGVTLQQEEEAKRSCEEKEGGKEQEGTADFMMNEFRTWQQNEAKKFEMELQNKERERISALEQEWARREFDRAKALKQAQEQYRQLETRMHKAISDAEKRERAVARLESDLKRAAEQKLGDLEVMHRRAREECDHKVSLEKEKAAALDMELKRLRGLLAQTEKRLAKVEDEYAVFREKTRQSPEAALQREIAELQGRNAELVSRIEQEKERTVAEALEKEKVKAQLVQVARELQRHMREDSKRAEKELEKLRLENYAKQEQGNLHDDQLYLRDLRRELNKLRLSTLPNSSSYNSEQEEDLAELSMSESKSPQHKADTPTAQERIERLIAEREDLLRTGLYGPNHPLIKQINRHIQLTS